MLNFLNTIIGNPIGTFGSATEGGYDTNPATFTNVRSLTYVQTGDMADINAIITTYVVVAEENCVRFIHPTTGNENLDHPDLLVRRIGQ